MSLSTPSMLALLYDVRGGTLPPWSPKAAGARASLRFSLCRWRQMRYMGREMTPKESSDIECIGSLGESGNCCCCFHVFVAAPVGFQVQDAVVGIVPLDVSPETVRDIDHE